jgi:hypothetical protein
MFLLLQPVTRITVGYMPRWYQTTVGKSGGDPVIPASN